MNTEMNTEMNTADIMTTPANTIAPDTRVREIVALPLLRDNQLVCIVARADLIQALVQKKQALEPVHVQTDEGIRQRLLAELEMQRWWRSDWSAVYGSDGVVSYRGLLGCEDERRAARIAAENMPGVRGVEDHRIPFAAWQAIV